MNGDAASCLRCAPALAHTCGFLSKLGIRVLNSPSFGRRPKHTTPGPGHSPESGKFHGPSKHAEGSSVSPKSSLLASSTGPDGPDQHDLIGGLGRHWRKATIRNLFVGLAPAPGRQSDGSAAASPCRRSSGRAWPWLSSLPPRDTAPVQSWDQMLFFVFQSAWETLGKGDCAVHTNAPPPSKYK